MRGEIRHYEIWGPIGQGGMSEVFLARHTLLAVPVVLKTVLSAYETDSAGEARVLQEAKLMARIPSPRVVRAIDAGIHERHPYLVEEYVDGIDLAELDRRRRAALGLGLPLWFVCEVMQAACEALHLAHQTGVVHRDLKPSNLFGSPQTGLRLGDFGIAAIAGAAPSGEIAGTIKFMSPEQLARGEASSAVDVWGAGATAFDLRYGRAPFSSAEEVLDPARPPPFPEPGSPAEAYFQHVLRGMLDKDPARRTANVAEPMRHFGLLASLLRARSRRGHVIAEDRCSWRVDECLVRVREGDVAEASADAIVSSANESLRMRAGVGDALRRRGGDAIEEEALAMGRQPLGTCVATGAGSLRAKHVLHAVSAWKEASCVGRAMQRALLVADELGLGSLAVVALGTGQARVRMETCASAMMTALRHHLLLGGTRLREVDVHLWDAGSLETFRAVADEALHGASEPASLDLGLPHDPGAGPGSVRIDGATWVDAQRKTRGTGL